MHTALDPKRPATERRRPIGVLPTGEARARHRRRRGWKERLSRGLVGLGGISVIVALGLIFLYLFLEVVPLLRPAAMDPAATYPAPGGNAPPTLHVALDRHREVATRYTGDGRVIFHEPDGSGIRSAHTLPIPADVRVTSFAAGEPRTRVVAHGLSDGTALVVRHAYDITYPGDVRLVTPKLEFPLGEEPVPVDVEGRSLAALAVQEGPTGGVAIAAYTADGRLLVVRYSATVSFMTGETTLQRSEVTVPDPPVPVHRILLSMDLRDLVTADDGGALIYYDITGPEGSEIRILGEISRSETVTAARVREGGFSVPDDADVVTRYLFKLGNRDLTGRDFTWYIGDERLGEWRYPQDVLVLERTEWGDFFGYLRSVSEDGVVVAEGEAAWEELFGRVARVEQLRRDVHRIERREIGSVNSRLERLRLDERRRELRGTHDPETEAAQAAAEEALAEEYAALEAERAELLRAMARDALTAETMDGRTVQIPLSTVIRATRPNAMHLGQKMAHYAATFWDFLSGYPREANTEGGISPAIFGTVIMVLLMSIAVTPFGILAAIYLREYARQGPFVQLIRISVNNLAGVPSIVFGVFGVGFFVYFVGGGLDRLFFPESLPSPTFGTPGLVWASLTLALLTLPVVIVATEEGLTRIPRSVREGSLALGATRSETIWKVVVPMAAPAMMTGLILAVARAAGEVAPLMLVGVVKLAPNLPIDGTFPFLHLERKFMHLGFHIYDVGFQSPNVEAARPLVYATALALVFVIVTLNLTAIAIRNRLRERYRAEAD